MVRLPYARTEAQGLGASMGSLSVLGAVGANLVAVIPALLVFEERGAVAVGVTLLLGAGLARWYRRAVGGVTGDLLGAACVLTELLVLAVVGGAGVGLG